MMGERQSGQDSLFYSFSLESHVPDDHFLRVIDKFADLGFVREHLKDHYSHTGRPSIDPELIIRMLLVGYCFGIRSEPPLVRGSSSQLGLSLVLPFGSRCART